MSRAGDEPCGPCAQGLLLAQRLVLFVQLVGQPAQGAAYGCVLVLVEVGQRGAARGAVGAEAPARQQHDAGVAHIEQRQLRGIQRLLETDSDCEQVAQQMAAARKALDKTFFSMVGCVIAQGDLPADDVADLLAKFS